MDNTNTPKINESKLTEEQRNQLDKWKHDVKSLRTLEDIATMAQEMLGIMDDHQKDPGRKTLIIDHVTGDDFVKILTNMQESLQAFKEQKEPKLPDYAAPVVSAVSKLEKALTASIKAIDVKPSVTVDAPPVNIKPSDVDLRGLEKILKTDLPKAFQESIKLIPQPDIPEFSNSDVVEKLTEAITLLGDIDTGVRLKPQPGSMRISNLTDETIPVGQSMAVLPEARIMHANMASNGNGNSLDVGGYSTAIVHVISTTAMSGGTTINFEASVDDSTWTAIPASLISSDLAATTATADGDYRINVTGFGKLRARFSSYSAGSTSVLGYVTPLGGGSSGGGNVSVTSTVPGTGATNLGKAEDAAHTSGDTGVMNLAVRNNSASALAGTDGDYIPFTTGTNGELWVGLATKIAGEDQTNDVLKVENQFSFSNITSATTTTVKSGAGLLHSIVINTPIASATITLYDNTAGSGTKIGTITLGGTLANDVYGTFIYDVKFSTGLTIVTSGATDLTISYR